MVSTSGNYLSPAKISDDFGYCHIWSKVLVKLAADGQVSYMNAFCLTTSLDIISW